MYLKVATVLSLIAQSGSCLITKRDSPVIFGSNAIPDYLYEWCAQHDGNSMPYRKSKWTIGCYEVTTQGPCDDGEWFVLDDYGDSTCKRVEKSCPSNSSLSVDAYGEGKCECNEGFGKLADTTDCQLLPTTITRHFVPGGVFDVPERVTIITVRDNEPRWPDGCNPICIRRKLRRLRRNRTNGR